MATLTGSARLAVCAALTAGLASAQVCTRDADCASGICFPRPGCGAAQQGECLAPGLVPPATFCGCDGKPFTWQVDGRWQSRPWQVNGCGLDAGVPLPPPRPYTLEVFDVLPRAPAAGLCEGAAVTLTPERGEFPDRSGLLAVVDCTTPLEVTSWNKREIRAAIPKGANEGCVSLIRARREDLALGLECTEDPLIAAEVQRCKADCARRGGTQMKFMRLPTLELGLEGADGPGVKLADDSLGVRHEKSTRLTWRSDATSLSLDGRPLANTGETQLASAGSHTLTARNPCGTVSRKLVLSATTLDAPRRIELTADGSASFEVSSAKAVQLPGLKGSFATAPAGAGKLRVTLRNARPGTVRLEGSAPGQQVELVRPGRGFADLHVHQFGALGFGGDMVFGSADAYLPDGGIPPDGGVDLAAPDCRSAHGLGGVLDIRGSVVRSIELGPGFPGAPFWGHSTTGWDGYAGWPAALDYDHQQVFATQLERAWRHGLRLIVMLAVNNRATCTKAPCDDTTNLLRQLDAAHRFAATHDWYRIVTSAAQAREAVEAGKLAVVLGVEVDTLGECVSANARGTHCGPAEVEAALNQLSRAGVRHVFPVHFLTNGFGGSALLNTLTQTAEENGRPKQPEACPADGGYEYRPGLGGPTACNPDGLTELGATLIKSLMQRGWIIDVDHQGLKTRAAVLKLMDEASYPFVAGHTWVKDVVRHEKRHEGTLTTEQLKSLRKSGGMVGILTNQANKLDELPFTDPRLGCAKSVDAFTQAYLYANQVAPGPVAFGSDLNGFAGQPAGRGPSDAPLCLGKKKEKWTFKPDSEVRYPFTDIYGQRVCPARLGSRHFDVQMDGLAHIGLEPDFIEAMRRLGVSDEELAPLLDSALGYVSAWERMEAAAQRLR